MSQVLTSGNAVSSQLNLMYVAAGLAAFLVGVVSAASGYRIYRRNRTAPAAAPDNQEKIEELNFMVDELKIEKHRLMVRNLELENQLKELNDGASKLKISRDVLEKSNLSLVRECEKLQAEKEALVLKTSEPLISEKIKLEPKARAKKTKGARKPIHPERSRGKRVSRKKK